MTERQLPTGYTMLEIMLVLGVAAIIVASGLKMYANWQQQAYIEDVRYNLTTLSEAMTHFYRAQCGNTATMAATMPPTAPYVLSLSTDLTPYLPTNWEEQTPLTNGYFLQFNPTTQNLSPGNDPNDANDPGMMVTVCNPAFPAGTACTPHTNIIPNVPLKTPLQSQAQLVTWQMQVAILVNDSGEIAALQAALGATCISSNNGTYVLPCSKSTGTGSYLVFDMLPTANASVGASSFWASMPWVRQFQWQYTHDQLYELEPGSKDNSGNTVRYYYCGA